ncbi:MAG TPA: VIT domain-containing protein [Candidatus Obscuribacterales bacterium]
MNEAVGKMILLTEPRANESARNLGVLEGLTKQGKKMLPLGGVTIDARIADRVAEVTISETFKNSFHEHLEAVYIFPMASGSSVTKFEMKVKERVIKGVVKERAEAQHNYAQAITEGKRAALLEQERDDIFTVKVGNLPPGEEVTVTITYCERLPFFESGATEIRLPTVVAPRYIPGQPKEGDAVGSGTAFDTDIVPDASRITPPLLAEGFDPKVSLSISVTITRGEAEGDGSVCDLACTQHAISTSLADGSVHVKLARQDELLNRDFLLRWRLASDALKPSLVVHRDSEGNAYGMLTLLPPKRDGFLGVPRDVVFVLDRSGSMGGVKMTSAARACSILLDTLGPRDRFAILAFDNVVEWMEAGASDRHSSDGVFFTADEGGICKGAAYLRGVTARGGTELERAITDALAAIAKRKAKDSMPIIIILTDGQIGDESRVLKRLQKEVGSTRVFTVGIDTAVNEGLLKRLASSGGGTATFVQPGTDLEEALLKVGREIGVPLVTDIHVKALSGKLDETSISPQRSPDLFEGRAASCLFRFSGKESSKKDLKLRITGRYADGGKYEQDVKAKFVTLPAVACLWAKSRIQDLEDAYRLQLIDRQEAKREIVSLSISHSVLSKFTAYVVIDESEITNAGGDLRTVVQPVHLPASWEIHGLSGAGMTLGQSAPVLSCKLGITDLEMTSLDAGVLRQRSLSKESDDYITWGKDQSVPAAPPPASPQEASGNLPARPASSLMGQLVRAARSFAGGKAQPPSIPETLIHAANEFLKLVHQAWTKIESGEFPQCEDLERCRLRLLKELSESTFAAEVPELQKFLRVEAVELIAALRAGNAGAARLQAMVKRHQRTFACVEQELQSLIQATPVASVNGGNFWEESV